MLASMIDADDRVGEWKMRVERRVPGDLGVLGGDG